MKYFGTTIQETIDAFRPHLGGRGRGSSTRDAWVRICISAVLLAAGLYFAARADKENTKLGMTLVGFVAGYWLK
jgi:hypothetical protein